MKFYWVFACCKRIKVRSKSLFVLLYRWADRILFSIHPNCTEGSTKAADTAAQQACQSNLTNVNAKQKIMNESAGSLWSFFLFASATWIYWKLQLMRLFGVSKQHFFVVFAAACLQQHAACNPLVTKTIGFRKIRMSLI